MSSYLKNIFLTRTGYFAWFFVFYAICGFATLNRYGVHYDEITQRTIGIENARFITGRATDADLQKHRFFGPLFETPAYLIEQVIYESSMHNKILLRRALLFSIFLLSVWCFHRIAASLFSWLAALFSTTLFACWPRLWAEAHYNSKDVLFLALCIFVIYRLLMGGKHKWWIVFMLLGLAMSVRIAGLFLLPVVVVFYAMKPEKSKWVILISGILIAFLTCYLVFPALWLHPFHGFRDLLFYGASNPWPSGSTLAGFRFEPGQIPGWYTPVWMFFTLPILYLLLFLSGLFVTIIKKQVLCLMPLLLLFFIPMCYMLATGPTLYNAWRHSLYLFFPIMIIAGTAIDAAVSKWKLTAAGVMAVLFPAAFLVSQSKFDYVYFNAFKSAFSPGNFTLDYWGISTRQALYRLNQQQPNGGKIYCFTEIVDLNRNLNPELTNRWKTVKTPDSADFILELNREGRFNSFHGLLLDAGLYQNDTVWALYQCRRFR